MDWISVITGVIGLIGGGRDREAPRGKQVNMTDFFIKIIREEACYYAEGETTGTGGGEKVHNAFKQGFIDGAEWVTEKAKKAMCAKCPVREKCDDKAKVFCGDMLWVEETLG